MLDQTMTLQDFRQHLLDDIEASKQTIESFSDEELEAVVGGGGYKSAAKWAASLAGGGAVAGSLVAVASQHRKESLKYRKDAREYVKDLKNGRF
jgi:homoserine acetyltransferase